MLIRKAFWPASPSITLSACILTHMRSLLRTAGTALLLALPAVSFAAQQSFTDVPANHPSFAAAEFLKAQGIFEGYEDGTFKPESSVNRAELMKLIVLQRVSLATITGTGSGSVFKDVPADAWFAPYVHNALTTLRIIDGPPQTQNFSPERAVTRAEFLKMLLLAYGTDPLSSYGEITTPLADDVTQPTDWYYPYVRYAFTASMLTPVNGELKPGETLTRADIADMLYRFLLYREGKRTQTLLSVTENEVLTALRMLESGAPEKAQYAAGRAMLASRGALSSNPDDASVKSAVKTAEAMMALVQAAQAKEPQTIIDRAGTAWHLGEKAGSFSSALNALVKQIQASATKIADTARVQPKL